MKTLPYKIDDNKIYCGITGMTPGKFVEIVTSYFKSFDKSYIPSRNTLSDIFDMVKGKKQGFSRSVIVKTAQEYVKKSSR